MRGHSPPSEPKNLTGAERAKRYREKKALEKTLGVTADPKGFKLAKRSKPVQPTEFMKQGSSTLERVRRAERSIAGELQPYIAERQAEAFKMSIWGKTNQEIADHFGVSYATIARDLAAEGAARSKELEDRRQSEVARHIALCQGVINAAKQKGEFYDELLSNGGKVSGDRTLDTIISAEERIARLLGLDAPTKIEIGVAALVEALAPRPGDIEQLA
jgi:hypothetical protein